MGRTSINALVLQHIQSGLLMQTAIWQRDQKPRGKPLLLRGSLTTHHLITGRIFAILFARQERTPPATKTERENSPCPSQLVIFPPCLGHEGFRLKAVLCLGGGPCRVEHLRHGYLIEYLHLQREGWVESFEVS
jgi:hypothetical protein